MAFSCIEEPRGSTQRIRRPPGLPHGAEGHDETGEGGGGGGRDGARGSFFWWKLTVDFAHTSHGCAIALLLIQCAIVLVQFQQSVFYSCSHCSCWAVGGLRIAPWLLHTILLRACKYQENHHIPDNTWTISTLIMSNTRFSVCVHSVGSPSVNTYVNTSRFFFFFIF